MSSQWSRLTNWLPREREREKKKGKSERKMQFVSCHTRCDIFHAVFKKYSRLIKKSLSHSFEADGKRWHLTYTNTNPHTAAHTFHYGVFSELNNDFFYPWTLFFKGLIKPAGSTHQVLSGSVTTYKGNKCLKLFVAPEGAAQSLMNCPGSFHLRQSWLGYCMKMWKMARYSFHLKAREKSLVLCLSPEQLPE